MIAEGVGEAGQTFEQDLELEQLLDLPVEGQSREPGLASLGMLALQAPRVAQQIVVDVALTRRAIEAHRGHGGDATALSQMRAAFGELADAGGRRSHHKKHIRLRESPSSLLRIAAPTRRGYAWKTRTLLDGRGEETGHEHREGSGWVSAVTGMLMGASGRACWRRWGLSSPRRSDPSAALEQRQVVLQRRPAGSGQVVVQRFGGGSEAVSC